MNTRSAHKISSWLILLACSLAASCSAEPPLQAEKVALEQAKETPKSLEDVVVASEDEVPTWNDSADKIKSSSEKTDSDM